MDNSAAAQYLHTLFGTRTGYVAAAYKVPNTKDGWQEVQFAWPKDEAKILGWAKEHEGDNVFICPALRRDAHTRKKGDMQPTRWLWADVDWQTVPEDKKATVHERIRELGTLIVSSGSGDNAHVYVELTADVPHEDFIKLNTGLRDYLYGDNKQADNSLLRLPGTTNWKTTEGSQVSIRGGHGRKATKAALLKRRAFRDAKVIADVEATEWDFVEVEGLPRRIRAMVQMPVDEAEARYGNRHKAVWAITGELHSKGFGGDEIHSLMHTFPAALSKAAEENGYDVHRDVDKRLAYERATVALTPEESEEIEDDAFEMAGDEDDTEEFERRVNALAQLEIERSEARKRARSMEAERTWIKPPPTVSRSLSDALRTPPEPEPFLIAGLAQARGNVVLTAQYKSGKTDLLMGTLARSLADGVPFLGHFEVFTPKEGMKVGHWNLEMDEAFLIDEYIRPSGYENTDNLVIASLRGYRVNILTEVGRAWTVEWLKDNEIKVWTIDSIAQLARMASVSENANEDMGQLLGAVDEIKQQAGVDACFLIAHTGRAEQEQGKERARAATIIDDWPDARWVMTVDNSDVRFLQAQGRGTNLTATSLEYDKETHRYTLGGQTRTGAVADGWIQEIAGIVARAPETGLSENTLWMKMKEIKAIGKASAVEFMIEAVEAGYVTRKKVASARGGRAAWMHFPAESMKGSERGMNASAAMVDMRNAEKPRQRRK